MNQYRVVYVEPGKPAVEKKIGTKLEDLQAEVGGLIECIYCHRDGTLIVANDEAKLHNITQCNFTFHVILFERLYISYY
jgi:hypothetical protein